MYCAGFKLGLYVFCWGYVHIWYYAGLAMGIALIMYGREEEADTLIESLCADKVHYITLWV